MATNEPLKPCPFCGSTHIQVTKCTQEFRAWVELDCRCGASAKALPEPGIFVATYEDAVAVWNRRPAAIPTGEPTLRELSARQWDWVERMGWHNKTHLEALALISSEVGEAVNECRGEEPTEKYGTELADIILRTLDEAKNSRIDITAVLLAKMKLNDERGTRGRRI